MVKRILHYFNSEIGGLHQAAYLLGIFAFLSQLLALVRDRLLAHTFGAGFELDLYYAAFRIPDFIFVTVASVVSISVLIPVLAEKLELGKEKGRKFLNTILTFFALVMACASIAAFAFMPQLARWIFPGFENTAQLISLSRLLLLSPVILGLSNLLGSVTQAHKRFFVYAASPLLYNLGIIAGIVFLEPSYGIQGVVLGVIAGALMHAAVQVPSVAQLGFLPRLTFRPDFKEIKSVVALSLPRTLALSISHISILFLISMASLMSEGSISVFNFSFNLQSVPLSIVGVSYSLAAFPTLAKLFSSGERGSFVAHILASARHVIFWALPVTVLFIVLRAHIVRVVLGSGEFDWSDTRLTAAALGLFMVSAVFQSLVLLLVRGFYSAGETKKPFFANAVSGISVIVFSAALSKVFAASDTFRYFVEALFRVEGIEGTSILMLPLGYSLGMILNGIILWALFERDFKGFSRPLLKAFFHSFSASVIMGFAAYWSLAAFGLLFDNATFAGIFLQGFLAGLAGIAVGVALLKALGSAELGEIWKALHKKFWKAKPVGPDPTITT